jgi:hypothetical protein
MSSDAELVASALAGQRLVGWVRADCPLCAEVVGTPDARQSLGLNSGTGGYHCFRCGSRGWVNPELLPRAAPAPAAPPEERPRIELPEDFWALFEGPGASAGSLDWMRGYVLSRGVSADQAASMGIGGVVSGFYANRVVVPIASRGELRGWSARDATGTSDRKYMYPKGMSREGLMFNVDALEEELDEPLLLVEGVFDAAPYWPLAAAFLGKPIESHIPLLVAARRPLVVCLDGDAWREGWALSMRLRLERGGRTGFVRLAPKTDPGSVDREWLLSEARRSLP